jgi:hypothetical protein
MAAIAGTFVVVSGLAYFAFMAAWLTLFELIGLSRLTQIVLGALACLIGAVNVKDYFAFGRGISFSIPASAKQSVYGGMRRILEAENLPAALISAVVLAVLVNTVELLCTSGLPPCIPEFDTSPTQSVALLRTRPVQRCCAGHSIVLVIAVALVV